MKRTIAIILACLLPISSITACSSGDINGLIRDAGSEVYNVVENRVEIGAEVSGMIGSDQVESEVSSFLNDDQLGEAIAGIFEGVQPGEAAAGIFENSQLESVVTDIVSSQLESVAGVAAEQIEGMAQVANGQIEGMAQVANGQMESVAGQAGDMIDGVGEAAIEKIGELELPEEAVPVIESAVSGIAQEAAASAKEAASEAVKQAAAEIEKEAEAYTEAETEKATLAAAAAGKKTGKDKETEAEPETESAAGTAAGKETGKDKETEAEAETEKAAGTVAKKESGKAKETEQETVKETEKETEKETAKETGKAAGAAAEKETEKETEKDRKAENKTDTDAGEAEKKLSDDATGFVMVNEVTDKFIQDMRYYSMYNELEKRLPGYEQPAILLTKEAADAVRKVSDALYKEGYILKIYDAYRPKSAQDVLDEAGMGSTAADHTRGSAVDVTLVDRKTGRELDMCGCAYGFIDREDLALTDKQKENQKLLKDFMEDAGFIAGDEWFHFVLKDEPYKDTCFTFPINFRVAGKTAAEYKKNSGKDRKLKFIIEFYDDGSVDVKPDPGVSEKDREE